MRSRVLGRKGVAGTVDITTTQQETRLRCPCYPPPTHNREPYDTLLYCPTSCPYRSVCGTDAACRLQF